MAINLLQFLLLRNEVYVPSSGMGDGLMTCFHEESAKEVTSCAEGCLSLASLGLSLCSFSFCSWRLDLRLDFSFKVYDIALV